MNLTYMSKKAISHACRSCSCPNEHDADAVHPTVENVRVIDVTSICTCSRNWAPSS